MKIIRIFGLVVLALLLLSLTLWGVPALYYAAPARLGVVLAVVYALCGLTALVSLARQQWRLRITGGFLVVFAVLVIWWNTLEPTNDRDWQTDVAVLPYATINGDLVTVHNIRNFDYRSEFDYIPAYYDKTFDMRKFESVDLVAVYWMGPAIAHTFVSFGFGGGDYLAISIETRKVKGENFSLLKGFFKQDELIYIVADERDVIRLRTNYRKDPPEEVYLYRVHRPIENGQRLFLEYVSKFNALYEHPQFYNTLLHNCTTSIWINSRVNPGHLPFSWKVLLSGYVPEYLYDDHALDTSLPFSELQRRNHVNARAHAADKAEDFSQLIRVGTVE